MVVCLHVMPIVVVLGGRHICLFVWLFACLVCRLLLSCVEGTFVSLCDCLLACYADCCCLVWLGTFLSLCGCLLACFAKYCRVVWPACLCGCLLACYAACRCLVLWVRLLVCVIVYLLVMLIVVVLYGVYVC